MQLLKHRTWVGTVYEDELMPEMPQEMYDEWYAKSYLVDGVRCGPELPLDYRIKAMLALRNAQWEQLQATEGELERLLDERAGRPWDHVDDGGHNGNS